MTEVASVPQEVIVTKIKLGVKTESNYHIDISFSVSNQIPYTNSTLLALVDTGATCNCIISRKYIRERGLDECVERPRYGVEATSASGEQIVCDGTVKLDILSLNIKDAVVTVREPVEAYVLDIEENMILGGDTLLSWQILGCIQEQYNAGQTSTHRQLDQEHTFIDYARDVTSLLQDKLVAINATKVKSLTRKRSIRESQAPAMQAMTKTLTDDTAQDQGKKAKQEKKCHMNLNPEMHREIKASHDRWGHPGMARTLERVKAETQSEAVRQNINDENVREYIKFCTTCQKNRYVHMNSPRYTTFSTDLGKEWEIDILYAAKDDDEMYDTSEDAKREKLYFAVIVEKMSRWVEILPIFNLSEDEVFRVILIMIGRFGMIAQISWQSDRGSNLTSKLNQRLMKYCGITHSVTLPYSHQQNGLVENRNRQINNIVRAVLYDMQDKYNSMQLFIPLVQRILNSLPIRTTGFAPAEILMPGLDLKTNLLLDKRVTRIKEITPDDYVHMVADVQAKTIQEVLKSQERLLDIKFSKPEEEYITYEVADIVLLSYGDNIKPTKWTTPYYGPFKILAIADGGTSITLSELADESITQQVHVSRIKPFHYDPNYTDVLEERRKDRREQRVNNILGYKGKPIGNKPNDVMLQVEWANGETSWEPYRKMRKLEIVKQYVRNTKELRKLSTAKILDDAVQVIRVNINNIKIQEIALTDVNKPHQNQQLLHEANERLRWNFPASLEDGVNMDDIAIELKQHGGTNQITVGGSPEEQARIRQLLAKYEDVFADLDHEGMHVEPMVLQLQNKDEEIPVNVFQGFLTDEPLAQLQKMITELEVLNIIEPAKPDQRGRNWNNRINLINESTTAKTKYRLTLDYSLLNKKLQPSYYKMPSIPAMIETMANSKLIGKMDLRKFYFQIPISEESRPLTAFTIPDGRRFQFTRCPMGIAKSAGYAQELATKLFEDAMVDDIMIVGNDLEEFLANLEKKLVIARKHNLKIAPDKTVLNVPDMEFLGRKVSHHQYWLSDDTRNEVKKWRLPTNVNELLKFLGLANYCRDFIKNFGTIAAPLYQLVSATPGQNKKRQNKNRILEWTTVEESAFEQLKTAIIESKALTTIDYTKPIFINSDASNLGYGAILYQLDPDGHKQICRILSGKFSKTQSMWPTIEQESYAIFSAVTKWRHLLQGAQFNILTDHRNITYILKTESKKILRWKLALQEFTFDVYHISGESNSEADILSRLFHKN